MSEAQKIFGQIFPDATGEVLRAFAPYRVCPLGAHVDHQHGFITGFAIDKGVELFYQPTDDGMVTLYSCDFDGEVSLCAREHAQEKARDWGDYARGSVWALNQRLALRLQRGIRGVVRGSLPIGGLSSSAAVTLCYLQALLAANGLRLTPDDLIETAHTAEKDFVGVNVGKLDQSCEVYSRAGHLLFLDTRDQSYELIETPAHMPPHEIVVFFSGLTRQLGSGFNNRVDQLRAAAWYLKALEGTEHDEGLGAFSDNRLRDIPYEVFERHERELPEPFRRRALHFYTECDRARRGAELWRAGDLKSFGQLVFASGLSSIQNYQTGSEHLIELYQALRDAPGVYGARFSGAGFKGCCMALVDPAQRGACLEFVGNRYLAKYPHLADAYSTHVCATADGVGVERA